MKGSNSKEILDVQNDKVSRIKKNIYQFIFPPIEYLNRKESAKFLNISISKFDKLDIEFIKYGKSKRFSIKTLRDYADEHTIKRIKNYVK